jgi:TRAP-type C4-dicarboxylate transport system permease small subunit
VIGRIAKAASFLGGLATLVIAGATTLDVLLRYFVNQPLLGVDEIAGFLQVLIVFWGCAHAFRAGGHIRVDLVTSHLGGARRAWLRMVTLTAGLLFLGVVCWVTTQSALTAYRYQRVSAVMLYPLWPAMLLIPTGLALMAAAMLALLVRQLRVALGPRTGRDEVSPAEEGG